MWAAIAAVRIGARRLAELVRQIRRRRLSTPHCAASWITASRWRWRHSPPAEGRVSHSPKSRTTARIYQRHDRDHATASSSSICANNPDQVRRADQRQPRRRHRLRADGVQGADRPAIRRPTAARSGRCVVPRARARCSTRRSRRAHRLLFRGRASASYDLMLRCLAPHMPDRWPPGISPRSAAPSSAACIPDTGRQYTIIEPQLGGWGARPRARRQQRDLLRVPRRDLQLPGRSRRGALRPRRRPHGAEPRAGRRGPLAWRQRASECDYRVRADANFLTVGYTRSRVPPWGARRRPRGHGQLRRGDPHLRRTHPPRLRDRRAARCRRRRAHRHRQRRRLGRAAPSRSGGHSGRHSRRLFDAGAGAGGLWRGGTGFACAVNRRVARRSLAKPPCPCRPRGRVRAATNTKLLKWRGV